MISLSYLILNFVFAFLIAKPVIKFLKDRKSIQIFRERGPKSHIDEKSGTPTIGGVIFLVPFFFTCFYLFYLFHDKSILLIFMAFFLGFLMGFVDDFMKVMQKNYAGLNSVSKLFIQFFVSAIIVYFLLSFLISSKL